MAERCAISSLRPLTIPLLLPFLPSRFLLLFLLLSSFPPPPPGTPLLWSLPTEGCTERGGEGWSARLVPGHTLCAPRLSTEKAARCLRSSRRIFSSSESGSSGLLYSSSSFSEAARSPLAPPGARGVEEEGSRALFFLHLVRRFWNHTCEEQRGCRGRAPLRAASLPQSQVATMQHCTVQQPDICITHRGKYNQVK